MSNKVVSLHGETYNYLNIMHYMRSIAALLLSAASISGMAEKVWSLHDCIDYALTHNITLRKAANMVATQQVNVRERQGAWLPTLSATLQENGIWRPLQENEVTSFGGTAITTTADRVSASGNYGISLGWTVYNGGQRTMGIRSAKMQEEMAKLSEMQQQNALIEQIAQLYVQLCYMQEAVKVNEQILHQDSVVYLRGKAFFENGKMAKATLMQLESTLASGYYDVVNSKSQIAEAKLQLAQLLELPASEHFEISLADNVAMLESTASTFAMQQVPDRMEVYAHALEHRPEMKQAALAIEQSQLSTKMAKAAYIPTVSLTAGVSDGHMTGSKASFGHQLRDNLNASVGVNVSIPILDQRRTKSAIQRAKIEEMNALLGRANAEKQLYQSIESYWIKARTSQEKYTASMQGVKSSEASYELLEEQFKVGIKNISELLQGRTNLLMSKQAQLQDKYTTALYLALLKFYAGEDMSL